MDNVVLFPKTEQFYEEELTRYLQKEQYGEAIGLLTLLLRFPKTDLQKTDQWQALLDWLQTMHPDGGISPLSEQEEEQEEEGDFLRQHVEEKSAVDTAFVDKLLGMLRSGTMEQQLAALEQLAFVRYGEASASVRSWLRQAPRHPHLQFKALQALKHMGERGAIDFVKNGNHIVVEIDDTPLSPEEFPAQIRDMIRRVEDISEMSQPDFAYFARQTWQEFLSYAYGTSVYSDLLEQEEGMVDIWASALHTVLQEQLFGTMDREELQDSYGIVDSMKDSWNKAHRALRKHLDAVLPSR